MASGKGTRHHRLRSWTGALTIIALPFFMWGFVCALKNRTGGIIEWLSSPFGAITAILFITGGLYYCRLEFDEVIMDYTDGGLRKFGLLANLLVALLAWAVSLYVIITMWLA